MGEPAQKIAPARYAFTNDWFRQSAPLDVWNHVIDELEPTRVLEVGCYEGRATVFLIERCNHFGLLSVTCVDTWEGAADLPPEMMRGVEKRFDQNIAAALEWSGTATVKKIRATSAKALPHLISEGASFDLIYVDGSHTAPDVLCDAIDCFRLLRKGGAMIFDDYLWCMEGHGKEDTLNMPKPAIDVFVNLFARQLRVAHISSQLIVIKA